jgi:hypothetical protein
LNLKLHSASFRGVSAAETRSRKKEEGEGRRKRKLEDGSYTQFLSKQTGLMTPKEQPITLLVTQECQEDITTHTYASQIESAFLQDPRNFYCI